MNTGSQGWYIIAYALGIYYLNLLIAFLTPKIDPAFQSFDDADLGEPPASTCSARRPAQSARERLKLSSWHRFPVAHR